MLYFVIIVLEFILFVGLFWAFGFLDAYLARWEHKAAKRIKQSLKRAAIKLIRWIEKLQASLRWKTRRIRRNVCAKILAKDGLTVIPWILCPDTTVVTPEQSDAIYKEVIRVIKK